MHFREITEVKHHSNHLLSKAHTAAVTHHCDVDLDHLAEGAPLSPL